MNPKTKLAVLLIAPVLAVLLAPPSGAASACVTFEPPLLLGTLYGAPAAQVSGDLAFTSSGVSVYVYKFFLPGGGSAFNRAYIDFAPVAFSPGQSIRTNNINLLFDWSAVGFNVTQVKLSYLDLGGAENLAVNGSGVYVGDIAAAPAFLGGAAITVTQSPVPPPRSGKLGTVTIRGSSLRTLLIGGQELWIDSVCAQ
jgi:hypothetical protein